MARQSEPSSEHVVAGIDAGSLSGTFLDDLRAGERDAFLRFFEAYRLPIYNFVLCLTRGREDAAAIAREVFVMTYRQVLLDEGAIDLRSSLYRVAVGVCRDHQGARGVDDRLRESDQRLDGSRGGQWEQSDLGRRVQQALEALNDRHYTALLLNDVHGLRPEETAIVLGMSTDAAKALLFRARETFLRAFEDLWMDLS